MQSNSKVLHFYNSFKRYTSLCMSVDYTISRNLRDGGIGTRPISSNGLWCCALLPALLISFNFLYKVSPLYTLVAYVAVGLFCYSILFVVFISVSCLVLREPIYGGCIASSLVSALMNFIFNTQGLTTSLFFSLTAVYLYSTMLRWSLTKFPKTYTIGEAMIVTQGLTLFTIAVIGRTMNILHDPNEDMNLISSIVLTALSTVGLLITGLCVISEKQRNIQTFSYMFAVAALFALVTLHVLLGLNCVFRILNYIFLNRNRVQLFAFWLFLLMISVFLVLTRTKSAVKVNTVTRKSFHLLASLVFMSGIIYDVYLTSLAAGIGLGLLILVEALRKLNITPISEALQSAFDVYSDEKDIGSFAMTPIYLYVGLACPLILVPSYEGTTLELLSGVLTTGVGDTAASWFGSKYGTKKWTNSEKTVEGTIANVLSQVATVYVLHLFGLLRNNTVLIRTMLAASISSVVEAKTDQVDNLILPLVTLLVFQINWMFG